MHYGAQLATLAANVLTGRIHMASVPKRLRSIATGVERTALQRDKRVDLWHANGKQCGYHPDCKNAPHYKKGDVGKGIEAAVSRPD